MTEPGDEGLSNGETPVGDPDEKPPDWKMFGIDYDRRRVEWVLWGLTDGVMVYAGKVDANGSQFYFGDFDQATNLWQAFAGQ